MNVVINMCAPIQLNVGEKIVRICFEYWTMETRETNQRPEKPTNIKQSLVYESQGPSCSYDPSYSCISTRVLSLKNAKGKINDLFTNTSKNVKWEWCYVNPL